MHPYDTVDVQSGGKIVEKLSERAAELGIDVQGVSTAPELAARPVS